MDNSNSNSVYFSLGEVLIFAIVGIVIIFCVGSCNAFNEPYQEKDCVDFYIKNGYILESCSKYKEQLETIKK